MLGSMESKCSLTVESLQKLQRLVYRDNVVRLPNQFSQSRAQNRNSPDNIFTFLLRWMVLVSSTFEDLKFDGSL